MTASRSEPAFDDGLPMPQRLWAVTAVLLGTFLGSLDSSIANIALPSIAADLGATPAASVWVGNGYQLATAVALLPLATLGERWGAKKLYIAGAVLFGVASLACAAAPGLQSLVFARVWQGLGGACSSVLGGVLMRAIFPKRLLGRGISLFGLTVAISTATGPSVAAGILTLANWRWLFAINVPIGAAAVIVAARFLPASEAQDRPFDVVGAALNALGITLLVLGVDALGAAAGGFVGALGTYGIPEDEAREYEEALKQGHVLLSVHASGYTEAARVRAIFTTNGSQRIRSFSSGDDGDGDNTPGVGGAAYIA